jgi:hypothetical protein
VQRSGGCVRACLGASREPETATLGRKLCHGCGGSAAAAAGGRAAACITRRVSRSVPVV